MRVSSVAAVGTMRAYSHFDHEHWQRVRAERAKLGLSRATEVGQQVGHPLAGRHVVDTSTGARYRVRSVRKDWHKGWFLVAWLERECDESHRTVVVENLSSTDADVLARLHRYAETFELVS